MALPDALHLAGITAREAEVLDLLTDHLSNREIAERLYLSPRTVEKHIAALLAKLDTPDRTALTQLAPSSTDTETSGSEWGQPTPVRCGR